MSIATFFATLSSLSLAIMLIFDSVMMSDCYDNNPRSAWLVSSAGGILFGLPMTFIVWWLYDFHAVLTIAQHFWLSTEGWLAFLIGAVTIQVMKYYFELFISEKGGETNETAIAIWLSTAPIWIFAAATIAQKFGVTIGSGVVTLTGWHLVVVLTAVGAQILFETHDGGSSLFVRQMKSVVMMLLCIVTYSLVASMLLHNRPFEEVLALQPYYWLGYGMGLRAFLQPSVRLEWRVGWPKIRSYLKVIMVAEIFGAAVYLFENYALWALDASTVNLIVGAHVIPVFIGSVLLAQYRQKLQKGSGYFQLFGKEVGYEALPNTEFTLIKLGWLIVVAATLSVAILMS